MYKISERRISSLWIVSRSQASVRSHPLQEKGSDDAWTVFHFTMSISVTIKLQRCQHWSWGNLGSKMHRCSLSSEIRQVRSANANTEAVRRRAHQQTLLTGNSFHSAFGHFLEHRRGYPVNRVYWCCRTQRRTWAVSKSKVDSSPHWT